MLRASRKPAAKRRFAIGLSIAPEASPLPGERERLRRLFTYLTLRRALGAEWATNELPAIEASVGELRVELRSLVRILPKNSTALPQIEALRAACRQFAARAEATSKPGTTQRPEFFAAVGALRALFGAQVVILSERFDIPIDPALDSILPPVEE